MQVSGKIAAEQLDVARGIARAETASSHAGRLSSLDLVRGIAAFSVAVPHYFVLSSIAPAVSEIISVLAVEVFFVLSGYVLAAQIIDCVRSKAWENVGIFLVRRWMRTIPPYAFALLVITLVAGGVGAADCVRYLFYVQNLFLQANTYDYYPVAWSLSVEEWFYVTFPVIAFVALKGVARPGVRQCVYVAIAFVVVIAIIRLAFGNDAHWGEAVRRVVVFRVDSIAYGFLLYAATSTFLPVARLRGGHAWAALALCFVMAAVAFYGVAAIAFDRSRLSQQLFPFYVSAFGCSAIFMFYTLVPLVERLPVLARFSSWAGKISYSVYLFHIIIAQALHPQLSAMSVAMQLAIYACCVTLFCTAFYTYFERPILAARPHYRSMKGRH